ncbi:MAG: DUF5132 domain-containing protein [Methylocystis sp.]|uniref:DUF5132 domain-containing protein n=1 Tax=Methylocystis sp. TaxID=1911079 RepID=UPI003DA5D8D1
MARLARSLFLALAAGVAGGAAATLLQRNGSSAHPTAKSAVRAGLKFYERMRGAVGEMAETVSDIVAEAQADLEQENRAASAANGHDAEGANSHDANSHDAADEHVVPFEMRAAEAERKAHG